MKLARLIAETMNRDLEKVGVYGRKGMIGERKPEEIGVLALRGGDVVGEHTVYFAGLGERIEITHRASSRETFARGALRAAKWIVKQKQNGIYDMSDVLGLK
jgi:4-hydroxy-tetrahydrodipicolinate reductase